MSKHGGWNRFGGEANFSKPSFHLFRASDVLDDLLEIFIKREGAQKLLAAKNGILPNGLNFFAKSFERRFQILKSGGKTYGLR